MALLSLLTACVHHYLAVLRAAARSVEINELISVNERKHEIAVQRVAGVTEPHVLIQFSAEATALSLFGGLLGIVLGQGLALAGSTLPRIPFTPDAGDILSSLAFSACVGIVSGITPAR